MTLSSTNLKDTYDADGVTRDWPITFPIDGVSETEIEFYVTDTDGNSVLTTNGVEVDLSAVKVVYPTEASGLDILTTGSVVLLRNLPLKQENIDVENQGNIPLTSIEAEFDRVVMMVQQTQEEVDRCIKGDVSNEGYDLDDLQEDLDDAVDDAETSAAEAAASAVKANGVQTTFDNSDLSSGVYTISHSLGLTSPFAVRVVVVNNNSKEIGPDDLTFSANSVAVDLSSFGTITGTWAVLVGGAPDADFAVIPDPSTGSEDDQLRIDEAGAYEIFTPITIPDPTAASENDQVRVDGAGAYETFTPDTVDDTLIEDADGDTKVMTEESADEDKIRFDTAGTQRAMIDSNGLILENGTAVNEISTDGTLAGDSDDAVPTEKAVKTYIDNEVSDLDDDIAAITPAYTTGFGSWSSGTVGSSTQVTSDSILVVVVEAAGAGDWELTLKTDSSNPPTTLRGATDGGSSSSNNARTITCPIKKDDYYLITATGSPSAVAYIIPIT